MKHDQDFIRLYAKEKKAFLFQCTGVSMYYLNYEIQQIG